MNTTEAFNIVLNLAKQNVIMDPEMSDEYKHQMEAIAVVEDFMKGPSNGSN